MRSAPTSCITAAIVVLNVSVIAALVLGSILDFPLLDPLFGAAIGIWIVYSAVRLARLSLFQLMDHELPDEEREKIRAIAQSHPDVVAAHDLRTRVAGPTAFIQLHIEMDGGLSLDPGARDLRRGRGRAARRLSQRRSHHPPGSGGDRGAAIQLSATGRRAMSSGTEGFAVDRGEPRDRARDGQALQRRRLADHHLLAGGGAGGVQARPELDPSHHSRSRQSRRISNTCVAEAGALLDGPLHALVNNAGVSPKSPTKERLGCLNSDIEAWHAVFHLNFFVPLILARAFSTALAQGKGAIVNVTSIAGHVVHPFAGSAYADFESGAVGFDARDGRRIRPARRPGQRRRSRRDQDRDAVSRDHCHCCRASRSTGSASPKTSRARYFSCAARTPPTSPRRRSSSMAASTSIEDGNSS